MPLNITYPLIMAFNMQENAVFIHDFQTITHYLEICISLCFTAHLLPGKTCIMSKYNIFFDILYL